MSAAEILNLVIRHGENLAEYLYDIEDDTIMPRVRKAGELGYWVADLEGNFTLTAKGAELVGRAVWLSDEFFAASRRRAA
jgi:hypothetical protein